MFSVFCICDFYLVACISVHIGLCHFRLRFARQTSANSAEWQSKHKQKKQKTVTQTHTTNQTQREKTKTTRTHK